VYNFPPNLGLFKPLGFRGFKRVNLPTLGFLWGTPFVLFGPRTWGAKFFFFPLFFTPFWGKGSKGLYTPKGGLEDKIRCSTEGGISEWVPPRVFSSTFKQGGNCSQAPNFFGGTKYYIVGAPLKVGKRPPFVKWGGEALEGQPPFFWEQFGGGTINPRKKSPPIRGEGANPT